MAMYQYFEDIHNSIKEKSCIVELIAMEAMKLTQRLTGSEERKIDAELLRTLTALVVHNFDIEEIKKSYKQGQDIQDMKQKIDESLKQMKPNFFKR